MAADAKVLEEDDDTGAMPYRYRRAGADHFSLAFTYECFAATQACWIDLSPFSRIA